MPHDSFLWGHDYEWFSLGFCLKHHLTCAVPDFWGFGHVGLLWCTWTWERLLLSGPWTWNALFYSRALMLVVSSVNCPPLHSTLVRGIWLQTGRCKRSYRLTWLKARSVPVASGMAASRSSNDVISISVISCSQCQFQSPLLAFCLGLGLSSQTFLGFYLCLFLFCLCFLYFLLCRWLLSAL